MERPKPAATRKLESNDVVAANPGMAGMRGVFDHPSILAGGSSPGAALARASEVALSRIAPGVDRDVGWGRRTDRAVAAGRALFDGLELDSGSAAVCCGLLDLCASGNALQLGAAWRVAGIATRASRAAFGDHRNSGPREASGVPGTFVRDAGLERRDGASGELAADGLRDDHGRGDDSHGGCGAGEAVWRGVPRVPFAGAVGAAEAGRLRRARQSERSAIS